MENWVDEIKKNLDNVKIVLEGQEGSCSRVCKVISDHFSGLSLLNRHRIIKKILEKHFNDNLHALSIETYTYEEWKDER